MQSLFAQTMPQEDMQIVLINDGSADGSGALCDSYAKEHENIKVIHQENAGVSAARNAGIRAAEGKYILYLDGDDTLSSETVKNVADFFDAHYYEVDLVTYPLLLDYGNGNAVMHWRSEYFKKTGVYDLQEHSAISQSSINVCIKNKGEDNIQFCESVKIGEDQIHNLTHLANKAAVGFVTEAQYHYYRDGESATSVTANPKHSFFDNLSIFKHAIKIAKANPRMRKYCENLILYNTIWQIKGDYLLPHHLRGQEYDAAYNELLDVLDEISNQTILEYERLDIAHRWYLISLKRKHSPFAYAEKDQLKILDTTGEIASQEKIQIVFNQIGINDDSVYALAFIKCYAFAFSKEKPHLYAIINGKDRIELDLFLSQHSWYWSKSKTNHFYGFHFSYPMKECAVICFEIEFQGCVYSTNFWYTDKLRVHPKMGSRVLKGKSLSFFCGDSQLEIRETQDKYIRKSIDGYDENLHSTMKKQWLVRKLMGRKGRKETWLYFDSHNSLDNGYFQFIHDFKKRDGIKRYYVYHADNPDLIRGKFSARHQKALVAFGSRKHKSLMFRADKILTAFVDRVVYMPFDSATEQYYADLFHYELIYLQHGVMHAKIPNMYSKEKVWRVDKIVASARFEKENFLNLGFREQDIITSGMPRLDLLQVKKSNQKRILFAPSWRNHLVKTMDGRQVQIDRFYKSLYYNVFNEFLASDRLKNFLEKNDCYLDVQIHPMFICYKDSFLAHETDRIKMTSMADLSDYMLCITDFSSIMFDFVYLDKPVISFFPDSEDFYAGMHSYNDFYYPLKDGFALYCEKAEEVMEQLEKLAEIDFACPEHLKEKYSTLYFDRTATHMDALYNTLMEGRK